MSVTVLQLNEREYDFLLVSLKTSIASYLSQLRSLPQQGFEQQIYHVDDIEIYSGKGRKGSCQVVSRVWNASFVLPIIDRVDMEKMLPPERFSHHVTIDNVRQLCLLQRLKGWNLKLVKRETSTLSDVYYSHCTMIANHFKSRIEVARFVMFEEYPNRFKKKKGMMSRLMRRPVRQSFQVSIPRNGRNLLDFLDQLAMENPPNRVETQAIVIRSEGETSHETVDYARNEALMPIQFETDTGPHYPTNEALMLTDQVETDTGSHYPRNEALMPTDQVETDTGLPNMVGDGIYQDFDDDDDFFFPTDEEWMAMKSFFSADVIDKMIAKSTEELLFLINGDKQVDEGVAQSDEANQVLLENTSLPVPDTSPEQK